MEGLLGVDSVKVAIRPQVPSTIAGVADTGPGSWFSASFSNWRSARITVVFPSCPKKISRLSACDHCKVRE
jgi:hypothetical protein